MRPHYKKLYNDLKLEVMICEDLSAERAAILTNESVLCILNARLMARIEKSMIEELAKASLVEIKEKDELR